MMLCLWPGCRCLNVGFSLLRYSVVYTIDSFSSFVFLLYVNLYLLGDDKLISYGSFVHQPNSY